MGRFTTMFSIRSIEFCFLFLVVVLFSCNGNNDSIDSLSGNYSFISEGPGNNVIAAQGAGRGNIFIPCNVIDHAYNEDYIIALQQPTKDCFWGRDTSVYREGSEAEYFWIIAVKTDMVYGPLTEAEYDKMVIELNVSKSVKLNRNK